MIEYKRLDETKAFPKLAALADPAHRLSSHRGAHSRLRHSPRRRNLHL